MKSEIGRFGHIFAASAISAAAIASSFSYRESQPVMAELPNTANHLTLDVSEIAFPLSQ